MAKEASSANPSVPLHEVLETEFAALHGKLPPDYPSSIEPNTRLKTIWAAVHELPEKRAALCISGGGIRSATFGLGVLQGLARCGLLDKFHYQSTVSGGGYIGSWLSAWINREGLASVPLNSRVRASRRDPIRNRSRFRICAATAIISARGSGSSRRIVGRLLAHICATCC